MKAWKKAIGIGIAVAAVGFVILTAAAVLIVTQPWVSANSGSEQPPPVDSKRLETDTRKLAEDFVPRDWAHTENLDRAAAYIRAEFEKTGAAVQDQVYDMEGRTYRNVIARFGPDSKDPVIVGAHYDAFSETSWGGRQCERRGGVSLGSAPPLACEAAGTRRTCCIYRGRAPYGEM